MELEDFVNESAPTNALGALGNYVEPEKLGAPIDVYNRGVKEIISFGTPTRLAKDPFVGRLLLLGVVSAAEGYIRAILASCIENCPIAQVGAESKNIHLGGLLWHGKDGFSRSAFEHNSFASRKEVVKAFRDFISVDLDESVFSDILYQFDRVCNLRHGIVHGDGMMTGRNAVVLGIPRHDQSTRIVIGYAQLQEATAVVNALIYTLNRYLFREMCKRWAIDWRQREDWLPDDEDKRFLRIWRVFHSYSNKKYKRGRSKLTPKNCKKLIKNAYDLPN